MRHATETGRDYQKTQALFCKEVFVNTPEKFDQLPVKQK